MIRITVMVDRSAAARVAHLPAVLQRLGGQARRLLVAALSVYPPPRGTYVRTYRLRRGWQQAPTRIDAEGVAFTNPVPYASFVQGDRQAWMHVGRWEPARVIVERHAAALQALYEQGLREELT
jgi:hypothetical protein